MNEWLMLTVVGEDRPGIVARLSRELVQAGAHLGEASMLRLGGSFTMMLMVRGDFAIDALREDLASVGESLALHIHIDPMTGDLHQHRVPEVRVHVHGADRVGIVAEVTEVLAGIGFDIFTLDSDVAGLHAAPIYVMQIEGVAADGVEAVEAALAPLRVQGIDVRVEGIETLVG
ncbi:amino acid-binding protein [Acidihalobacter yilgarnensis]|uniref:Amino acid-binding protein n=1 Tax=Acidihalobacter yilgarnensis TaxID=2819280 RepID=A0A1D8IRF4_9GAMM|nr:ACT domain-containing protein [Acidihalobacter yilgarnensis]AOU98973.1 amino acid-binding protein [Acidihalobacter yilgarnensis]